jgi:TatD DNase family protein
VQYVAAQVADLREIALTDLAVQTTQNACSLFGLTL